MSEKNYKHEHHPIEIKTVKRDKSYLTSLKNKEMTDEEAEQYLSTPKTKYRQEENVVDNSVPFLPLPIGGNKFSN